MSTEPSHDSAAGHVSLGRLVGVVNLAGGGCDAGSSARMAEIFASAGQPDAEVLSVGPDEIEATLIDAAARSEVVVVLGGDGTIRTAAIICGKAGRLLIPLAGGTLNMLPRALYGPLSWEKALASTLAAPKILAVSGGDAGGQRFFCAAVFGAPSLWADTREALRQGDVLQAAEGAVTAIRRHSEALAFRFDEQAEGQAEAVVVICPLVSKAQSADEQALEASAFDPSTATGILGLAFHAIFDDWRRDPSVNLAKVTILTISAHGRVPAILDGEKADFDRMVTVTFVPVAFQAVVPAGNEG